MESAFIDLLDSILPALFVSADSITTYYENKTETVAFYLSIGKLVVSLVLLGYVMHMYFIKGQATRVAHNKIDIIFLLITVMIICVTIYFTYQNMKKEKANATTKKTTNSFV